MTVRQTDVSLTGETLRTQGEDQWESGLAVRYGS